MGLADDFQSILDALPEDWTDLELDLRIADESRYVEAATALVTCPAQPYSYHDWHWRIPIAQHFGHAGAPSVVRAALALLDRAGIGGELALREVREGRTPVEPMWGRPESVRRQMRRVRAQ